MENIKLVIYEEPLFYSMSPWIKSPVTKENISMNLSRRTAKNKMAICLSRLEGLKNHTIFRHFCLSRDIAIQSLQREIFWKVKRHAAFEMILKHN